MAAIIFAFEFRRKPIVAIHGVRTIILCPLKFETRHLNEACVSHIANFTGTQSWVQGTQDAANAIRRVRPPHTNRL
ncbi:MAG: hypothetical protein AB7F72_13145 [Afipia sp.]